MIDTYQLHDALRFSGLGPDVPFHATDSSHELRLQKLIQELGDAKIPDERDDKIAELTETIDGLEMDLRFEENKSRDLQNDLDERDEELRKLRRQVLDLPASAEVSP